MNNKQSLFDSDLSEDESEIMDINFGNKYATKYNDWRRKEEMQRLKDKYGENLDIMSEIEENSDYQNDHDDDSESESSSNLESENEYFDEQFATVLSALKTKDPKIYEKNFSLQNKKNNSVNDGDSDDDEHEDKFKDETVEEDNSDKKMTLSEYHKKLLKEKKGITEEDEGLINNDYDDDHKPVGYYQELYNIRQEIKDIVGESSKDVEEDSMFLIKDQSSSPPKKSQKHKVDLSQIWNENTKLNENDAFLRDYIVNKRYAESVEDLSKVKKFQEPSSHFGGFENYHKDELGDKEEKDDENDEKTTLSRRLTKGISIAKYHFEEPDANVMKRFPRNVPSVRDTIAKETKTKRAEVREKKKQEKESELKKMRKFKREEMEIRISKLKEASGNKKLDIKDLDLNVIIDDDNDFDLEKYDKKMNLLFGNDYYNINDETEKPKFAYCEGIDDDLYPDEEEVPKCIKKNKKWKEKKDNKKLDIMKDDDIGIYEDLIAGEIATRFRYRMVETNDFGLTDEEILFADDKELNRWCSLKKMSQYRSKGEEEHDKHNYDSKKNNLEIKKKILKSLYGEESKDNPIIEAFSNKNSDLNSNYSQKLKDNDGDDEGNNKRKNAENKDSVRNDIQKVVAQQSKKKKNKRRGKKKNNNNNNNQEDSTTNQQLEILSQVESEKSELKESESGKRTVRYLLKSDISSSKPNRKRKRKQQKQSVYQQINKNNVGNSGLSESRLKAYGMSNREIKRVKI